MIPVCKPQAITTMCIATLGTGLYAKDDKWKTTYAPEPQVAHLLLIQDVRPGDTDTTAEYTRGDAFVRCKVSHAHNLPTQQQAYSGNLNAIYLIVAGKPHPNPKALCDKESLLKAFKGLPITVKEEKMTKKGHATVWRYKIKFGKGGPTAPK